ncbi:hypothetical protein EDB86DRAFT_3003235 [Lactarius hatsudake]|nr:hypothetical protein EDB86DRAFT_3003235 [Lactarius hatsudake]
MSLAAVVTGSSVSLALARSAPAAPLKSPLPPPRLRKPVAAASTLRHTGILHHHPVTAYRSRHDSPAAPSQILARSAPHAALLKSSLDQPCCTQARGPLHPLFTTREPALPPPCHGVRNLSRRHPAMPQHGVQTPQHHAKSRRNINPTQLASPCHDACCK